MASRDSLGSNPFQRRAISDAEPPPGPPGLVIVNPPYGARIGETEKLKALYGAFGKVMRERFASWRVGLIAAERELAHVTGLPFAETSPPIPHGGLKIKLMRTDPL